jgi:hypothetical protein
VQLITEVERVLQIRQRGEHHRAVELVDTGVKSATDGQRQRSNAALSGRTQHQQFIAYRRTQIAGHGLSDQHLVTTAW